jgi:FAD/FMN-containing dehydrogenase
MNRVIVDAARRTARVEAGASWRDVIEAAAPHGRAPLNGSSPHVGAVGYTRGGGVGLLARRFGFAADHVREMDLVTADGRLRRVSADTDVDLFWAYAPFLVELRAWGGALSRSPAVPNAVSGRDARFSLLAISDAAPESRSRRDDLLHAMGAWGTGGNALNFAGVDDASAGRVRQSYDDAAFERLRRIKTEHDPHNRFRVNFNIAPHEKPLDGP